MINEKLIVKGSMHGVKKYTAYKTPDIVYSIVDDHKCQVNDLKIAYLPDKKLFYIYHSYKKLDDQMKEMYSGRWYITDYSFEKKDLDENDKSFTILLKSIAWEDFDTGNTLQKNVNVTIQFTPRGFNKVKKFFTMHNESDT